MVILSTLLSRNCEDVGYSGLIASVINLELSSPRIRLQVVTMQHWLSYSLFQSSIFLGLEHPWNLNHINRILKWPHFVKIRLQTLLFVLLILKRNGY